MQKLEHDIFSGVQFKGEIRFREPMSSHSSLKIGGPADVFAAPRDLNSLMILRDYLQKGQIPCFPLGGGTNILVRDGGIEGVVISLQFFRRIELLKILEGCVHLNVEAGAPLARLVNYSMEKGYAGIEGLAGIPGTVGGAICGNAGAFGCEIGDVLFSVELMDAKGKIRSQKAGRMKFGYRSSGISPEEVILSARIKLKMDKKEDISERIENFLNIKREKQPLWEPSAGCVFRNPAGLSAGKLIDEAGCKGMRIGDAEVSEVHANFFINKGHAKASDFICLMDKVASKVKRKFDVVLEPEIRIVGRDVAD